jgi:hypothetical protein
MKWMKQVFAQRYNRQTGRIGHIWGDRYWSLIVEDAEATEGTEPMWEQCEEGDAGVRPRNGKPDMRVRPRRGETALQRLFSLIFPPQAAPTPG